MAYKVEISEEAQIELSVAECYFRIKSLHTSFLQDFFKQIKFLESTPQSFQIKYQKIRIINFDDFNYSVHYLIVKNKVLILRILNQRQNF